MEHSMIKLYDGMLTTKHWVKFQLFYSNAFPMCNIGLVCKNESFRPGNKEILFGAFERKPPLGFFKGQPYLCLGFFRLC